MLKELFTLVMAAVVVWGLVLGVMLFVIVALCR